MNYKNALFSEGTTSHLRLQMGMSEHHLQRSFDVTLACKLTLTYGKYHLMMLHRQLAISEERTSFQQAEKTADMMKMYIMSMREVVDWYKQLKNSNI